MALQAQMYSGFPLGDPLDLLMENAYGFNNLSFILQQQKPQQEQSMDISQTVSTLIENQRIEIDQLINSQNERWVMALQEQRKQKTALFMKKYESRIQFIFKQKEEEIKRAAKRTMELQDYLTRMEIESQTWQRLAKENEAMVASLNRRIQRLRETDQANAAEDAESCCFKEEEKWEQKTRKMICRCCNSRKSCVVMLPCSHLSSCEDCEQFLDSCPVCKMVKAGTIEALV